MAKKVVLTPLQRERKARMELQRELKAKEALHKSQMAGEASRIQRLSDELDRKAKAIADQNERLAHKNDEVAGMSQRLKEVSAERDRIVRIVDQFTSVQITPMNTSTSVQMNGNTPKDLRRT